MIPKGIIVQVFALIASLAITPSTCSSLSKDHESPLKFTTVEDSGYNFHVYCPVDSRTAQKYYRDYLTIEPNTKGSVYVVSAQSQNTAQDIDLFFCGLAREWLGTCSDAKLVCSAPGPMFYLPVGEEVTIVWINNIKPYEMRLEKEEDGCYMPAPQYLECENDAKIIDEQHLQTEGCTFYQPTNYSYPTRKVKVDMSQIPISPHIHGLEVRPAFDGNPLAWFNNKGDKGVGYISLTNTEYFSQFDSPVSSGVTFTNRSKNMRAIKAPNKQTSGTIMYHDHAMKSTEFNVHHGLVGFYVLYNKTAEKSFPKGSQQKYIVFSPDNDGDLRNKAKASRQDSNRQNKPSKSNLKYDSQKALQSEKDAFNRNTTYRFRILNSHYENNYYNISFGVYSETFQLNKKKIVQQINPYTPYFPLTSSLTKINFTVIGTDSALLHEPIHNVDTFNLTNAERMDILIKFDGVPRSINHVYIVCFDQMAGIHTIKFDFLLSRLKTENKYPNPIQTQPLDIPFYNLSNIPQSQVALSRMRPLFSRPRRKQFQITGHYMFNMGEAERPKIGTIQDWYYIGHQTPHSMHIHLINFQIMQTYSLKVSPEGCPIYELDYFRYSNYSKFLNLSNADLCNYLVDLTLEEGKELFQFLGNYSLQNDLQQSYIGKISGLNALEKVASSQDLEIYANFKDCSLNGLYKYICDNTTDTIPEYQKRWKDSALVKTFQLMVLRIRWASPDYDESVKDMPYFNAAAEDELIQFPGFIYHCHMLRHEDNEMMRSYMLAPSDRYMSNKTRDTRAKLRKGHDFHRIKKDKVKVEDIWFKKAEQINEILNCAS